MRGRGNPISLILVVLLFATAVLRVSEAAGQADTLTVIQRPLLNIPAIVRPGDALSIQCEAAGTTSDWTATALRGVTSLPMEILDASYNPSTLWWTIRARVPNVTVYELYDLVVTASGGIADTSRHSICVIPEFREDYYFVHITDTHLPTHRYYYEQGSETDSTELVDLREVINDINIINPAFVVLTGDLVNEGELEDFLGRRYFSRSQRLLRELKVPLYLTAGNHDVGGWVETPVPAGTARHTWWRFFGWPRLDEPPAGAPSHTQDYSFDYGPVHYVGMEAYNNYEYWRPEIYGTDSFTSEQMLWLADNLAAAPGSTSRVLFYHSDFQHQINLSDLGVALALSGHTHSNTNDTSPPYNVVTAATCDGKRTYRLVRVANGVVQPSMPVYAGSNGTSLNVAYSPDNDGTNYSVTATITNTMGERFEHSIIRFTMPNEAARAEVTGGTLAQVDRSGYYATYYVAVDILASSTQTVTLLLDTADIEPPVVVLTAPNGGEVWEQGSIQTITWTATDNLEVTSIDILLSRDGGLTFPDTLVWGVHDDGAFDWIVDQEPTTTARVKVVAFDRRGNNSNDASDTDFRITGSAAGIPSRLLIESASPNPFSDHTAIKFGLPKAGLVRIDLYDVYGRFVKNIVEAEYPEGYQTYEWDNDGSVASGVYFLRLQLGDETATRKAVIPR